MKNKLHQELAVCGFAAVKALEQKHPEQIRRLYFTSDRASQFGDLCRKLSTQKIPYNMVESSLELEKLCGSVHHQGVVAMIPQPEIMPLTKTDTDAWVAGNEAAIILDRIGNANNLGAIVRSAAYFGVKNIVLPIDEAQSSVTTSSYRVAQGGMESVNMYTVNSAARLLEGMKGRMIRIGTDLRAKTPVSEISVHCKDKPPLIVLGNEETGISDTIRSLCDLLVIIPGAADVPAVESLNVAQAASVILYECCISR